MTTTPDPRAAAAALREAMVLLARAGELLPQAAQFAHAAYDSADTALMIADNEAKLAADDAKRPYMDKPHHGPDHRPTGYGVQYTVADEDHAEPDDDDTEAERALGAYIAAYPTDGEDWGA